jgi:PPOX class probable F420-dependent enzyme
MVPVEHPRTSAGTVGSMALTLDQASSFVADHNHGVLVTLRQDGRPQLSNILYVPGPGHTARISVTDSRAKTANLRRDPRASLHVTSDDFWSYVVLDGTAALSPVATSVHDPVVEELSDMYRLAQGEHPNWDEFAEAMITQRRIVATLTATHAYGQVTG